MGELYDPRDYFEETADFEKDTLLIHKFWSLKHGDYRYAIKDVKEHGPVPDVWVVDATAAKRNADKFGVKVAFEWE